MTFAAAPMALGPDPKVAAALLAAFPGHPLLLERTPEADERLRQGLAPVELVGPWEVEFTVPAGFAPWPVDALEAGLADAWGRSGGAPPPEAVEALTQDALLQASHLQALAARLDLALRGCRLVWAVHWEQPCRKLHRDTRPLRVVTTYAGPGTEWVLDEALLGAEEVPDEVVVQRCPLLTPLVLPGKLAPAPLGPGVIHRSPPADGASPRLVLRVDALPTP